MDEQQPIGVEDFLIPAEEEQGEPPEVGGEADEVEQLPAEEPEAEEDVPAEDEGEEEAPAPIDMPTSWGKDDAEAWKALPAETQAVIARREGELDKYVREAGRKTAETKLQVENQAREIIAKQAEDHATALAVYAAQFAPQAPDQRLLYTGNPDDVLTYQRQDAAYRAASAQQQQLQQAAATATAAVLGQQAMTPQGGP